MNFKNYYYKISNSGHDERGKYSGGTAGDQTGQEWAIINWYNRPWTVVLRYPDQDVRELIAELSIEAANNNYIGYDQSQRETYWNQLKKNNYRPSLIKIACEADCSDGVIANVKAAGYIKNISSLKNLKASYTGDMKKGFKNAGFQLLTAKKYLTSPDYLMPGDILLYQGHHTATNLGIGKNITYNNKQEEIIIGKNLTNVDTKEIQKMLNKAGNYQLVIDGDYGAKTTAAVKDFQSKHNLQVDGIVGNLTLKKLQELSQNAYNNTPLKTGTVTAYLLNVRKGPSLAYDNLISYPTIPQGTIIEICEEIRNEKNELWYFIKINGDKGYKYGFVKAEFIKV